MGHTIPIAISVKEACRLCGFGRTKFYGLLAAELGPPTIKIGRQRLVLLGPLSTWVQGWQARHD
jgi:hypothetical protein